MNLKSLMVLALLSYALSVNAEATTLAEWIGKYPSDKISGTTANEVLMKSHLLKKILPPSEIKLIKLLTTEDLISKNSDYIIVSKCKPHACPSNHSMTIEKSSSELWVGIYQNNGETVSTRWYGTSEYTDIPPSIQKLFIRGHIPE